MADSLVTPALARALQRRPLLRRSVLISNVPGASTATAHLLGWLYVLPWKSQEEIRKDLGWPEPEERE
jgi:hypothetical protein